MDLLKRWVVISGYVIAIGNGLCVLNSSFYFLVIADFPIDAWLMFNACAPAAALFLIGFILRKRGIMMISTPFLVYYGAGGLFLFGWRGPMIFAQISHIFMVAAVMFVLYINIQAKRWKQTASSFAVGLISSIIIIPFQFTYVKEHPHYLKQMGDPQFESFINKQTR